MYHLYRYTEDSGYDSNNRARDHHDAMITCPNYRSLIEDIIPGMSEEWYDNAVWAGNQDSDAYDNL